MMYRQRRRTPAASPPRTGFTLVEVLVALTILAIGVVGVTQLFPTALRQVQQASLRTQVTQAAGSKMSAVKAFGGRALFETPAFQNPVLSGIGQIEHIYEVYAFERFSSSVQRLNGASAMYLQRVTLHFELPGDQIESFVTYVSEP
jgi:prepilin-type N-terminal cleavage/methylation domain-containing protein